MKANQLLTILLVSTAWVFPLSGQEAEIDPVSQKAADLEAQVRKLDTSSVEGANALLELVDLYHENARGFGLVRAGKTFVKTHRDHPRHKEVMLKLLDGQLILSRNEDIVSTSRQFLEFYGKDRAAAQVALYLAEVLDRQNKKMDAAKVFERAWRLSGTKDQKSGYRAVRLFGESGAGGAKECGRLALEMLDKLKGTPALELGTYAFARCSHGNWDRKGCIALGEKLIRMNLIRDPKRKAEIHYVVAGHLWGTGQRVNAITHYRKAWDQQKDNEIYLNQLITVSYDNMGKAGQLKPLVDDYKRRHPTKVENIGRALSNLAHAYAREKQLAQAVVVAVQALPLNPGYRDLANYYVRWINELDPKRLPEAEQALRGSFAKAPLNTRHFIRLALALDIYRDRTKDVNRARNEVRQILREEPVNDGKIASALHWYLSTAPDEGAFRREAQELIKYAQANGHLSHLRSWLQDWAKGGGSTDLEKGNRKWFRGEVKKLNVHPEVKEWIAFEKAIGSNKPSAFISLSKKLNTERKFKRFHYELGFDYRHYAGSKDRALAIPHFKELAKRFAKDATHASNWLEASQYGTETDQVEALRHLLQADLVNDPTRWYYALNAAGKSKDAALLAQSYQYLTKAEDQFGKSLSYFSNNYSNLIENEKKAEADQYFARHKDLDPGSSELRTVILLRLDGLDENAKSRELDRLRKADNDQHGAYAGDYAGILFAKKDWKNFIRVLKEAKTRQDQRPIRTFTIDAGKVSTWIASVRKNEEISADEKVRLLESLRDLDVFNYSIYAHLALLDKESQKKMPEVERLKAMRAGLLRADNGSHGWNVALGFAQSALSAGDYAGAATLLTGAQAYAGSVPASYKETGRGLLAQAYSRIGGVGMTIDKESPLAPLMEILLQLRLGDNERALQAYLERKKLFDKHRSEMPLELILFAAESHVAAGGDENHQRVEDLLAVWLVKNDESKNFTDKEKASVRLLLARNYFKWLRYDAARSEYTTVKNSYPDSEDAVEAEFGIGESFMSQKNYSKAEEIFEDLANSRDSKVIIRAEFMRGLLASNQGDRDQARDIFRSVLERVPDVKLANETLYHLAEVYGIEQRFMDQLQLLRAVGRLGQTSKRWHEPGAALSIVVQDSDLGISRGHTSIPVNIRTQPGGDAEQINLISGGAGKGLFMAELPTALGIVSKDDRVLQLKGGDVITVDYPDDFKKEFKFHMMGTNEINVAADGLFDAASSPVIEEGDANETFTDKLISEEKAEDEEELSSEGRPDNEIKPGNYVYLRVRDFDRDLTDQADRALVKLDGTSGDSVTVELEETGPSTGIFLGRAQTGELPAGALASDVSIESSPLMSIDKDSGTSWISEPDGSTPKWLKVDLKDVYDVTEVTLRSPNQPSPSLTWTYRNAKGQDRALVLNENGSYEAKAGEEVEKGKWQYEGAEERFTLSPKDGNATTFTFNSQNGRFEIEPNDNPHLRDGILEVANQTPVRMRMNGSHDGRFWYELSRWPAAPERAGLGLADGPMTMRIYQAKGNPTMHDWERFSKWINSKEPEETKEVDDLEWIMPEEVLEEGGKESKLARIVTWAGNYAQPNAGATRFFVSAENAAIMIDGKLVMEPDTARARKNRSVDVFLESGIHELTILAYVSNHKAGGKVTRARENPNVEQIVSGPFRPSDFDQAGIDAKEDDEEELAVEAYKKGSNWTFSIPAAHLRHVEFIFEEYVGQSLAINQVEVKAGEKLLVPTDADILAMSENDILEITAGDEVVASYVDEFGRGGIKNRLLTKTLTATYYNAKIRPVSYAFVRTRTGQVQEVEKELMRIDPGERIVVEVTDYDMDLTPEVDKLKVEVFRNNDDPITLEAIETEENSGIFRTEIDTSAEKEEGKLQVSSGDRVNLRYVDPQNTFPGHSFPREGLVFVRKPTDGFVRIVETRFVPTLTGGAVPTYLPRPDEAQKISGFAYEMPLTIEVIDPDAAKDSLSTTTVKVVIGEGNATREAVLECELSSAFGESETAPVGFSNWPLYEGRFVGQAILRLGGAESPIVVPVGVDTPGGLQGGLRAPEAEEEGDESDLTIRVVNLSGSDLVVADYEDVDRTEGNGSTLSSKGKMIADGELTITEPDYDEPVSTLYMGEKIFLRIVDPDRDLSPARDRVEVKIETKFGEKEIVSLEETFSHSGVFTGSFRLEPSEKPVADNLDGNLTIESFFGDLLSATYHDPSANSDEGFVDYTAEATVSIGADGLITSFSKIFADEELAVRTQFHVAESYFELFKSHLKLGREEEASKDLENGRLHLKQLVEDYPDPKYAPRVNYLLGQFSQELKEWDKAIEAYETIVRSFPEHMLAADAQYKLAQAYEEAKRFDDALEAYVTLASTYPKSPLIANAMIRISEYFYKREVFDIAAQVGIKFVERFDAHKWSPKMAFRVGQCHYKNEKFTDAALAFDSFVKKFPDAELCSEALFWGGESYRMGKKVPLAFQRYNRCRWDFPESDAAKYSRGRLALPEMLSQFEKEANLDE
jgi:TolA-binding protein